ncbi:MAG TPA: M48 family metalloprotease [Terriglobales bacterium]|nr:M48 family metalloprotease [Terriglobales bacterium]
MATLRFLKIRFWVMPLLAILSATCLAQAPVPGPVTDQETELGQAAYKQLRDKGEIVESSPLYETLKPIADRISGVAQPRYPHPFKFFLVHETQPNAFATPGGNVYVVDSLLYFVKNTEQLAGTLCHEVSHTIHRDGIALMEKEQKIEKREIAAAILLGPTRANIIAIALIGKLHSLGYSRDAESKADVTGSDICAEAGYNPWGLTWLFQDFQNADVKQIPQLLSDHPANGTRIKTLEKHFQENPSTFSKFSPDPKSATPFNVPKDAPEVFLHADTKGGN